MARVSVIVRWLEDVKIYGNKPKKLLNKINKNKAINMKDLPWNADGPNSSLNSECNFEVIELNNVIYLLLINQYDGIKNIIINDILIQLKGSNNLVAGSKTENKLVIIFSLFGFFRQLKFLALKKFFFALKNNF